MIPEVEAARDAGACPHWWRDRPFLHEGHCCMADRHATCHQLEGMAAFRAAEEHRQPLAELEPIAKGKEQRKRTEGWRK